MRVLDLATRLKEIGVTEVLYTDISKDGMMQSVDLTGIREVAVAERARSHRFGRGHRHSTTCAG